MSAIEHIKKNRRNIVEHYVQASNASAYAQTLSTLLPLGALWYAVSLSAQISFWLTALLTLPISLFVMRAFLLMHDCGHKSLFRSDRLNQFFGFIFGLVWGMPAYVWSQHHAFHHSTNGNWSKYRGPLSVVPATEYAAMSEKQQRKYRHARSIWITPLAGFLYVLWNPRINWLKGTFSLVAHLLKKKIEEPGVSIRTHAAGFKTRYWADANEYWQMFWNNVVLMSIWALMSQLIGAALFFSVYVASTSLAGAAGLVLFTVQHNFEHSYASSDEGWDSVEAAIRGTSFLILPRWLNWFTVDIAFHHVHHLSSKIPNYRLVKCHEEFKHLFLDVTRIMLADVPKSLKCILWDTEQRRIITVEEARLQKYPATA